LFGSVLIILIGINACAAVPEPGPATGLVSPLMPDPDIQRLPPVANAQPPSKWVSKPQFQDAFIEQSVEPLVLKTDHEEETNPISDYEEDRPIKLWEGSFSLGLDGAEGNNEAMNLHVGFNAQRKTDLHLLYLDLDYNRRTTDTISTANRLFSLARYERLIQQTAWSLFVASTGEYDEFQDFDFRVTAHGGVGYRFFATHQAALKSRFGSGFSHEIGGPKDHYYAPELIVGLDYERRISYRQRLVATVDYMPDISDFTSFRLNSLAGWEFLLDQMTNLSLRLAVRNRYNSSPGTAKPNDLDYAALLLWKF
jgi:putative salt-induced outer membrane protein YdiY